MVRLLRVTILSFLIGSGIVFLFIYYNRQTDFIRLDLVEAVAHISVRDQDAGWLQGSFDRVGLECDRPCRITTSSNGGVQLSVLNKGILVLARNSRARIEPWAAPFLHLEKGNAYFYRHYPDKRIDGRRPLEVPVRFSAYVSKPAAGQGKVLLVRVRSSQSGGKASGHLAHWPLMFYHIATQAGVWEAIQGVDVWASVGKRPLVLTVEDSRGNWLQRKYDYPVERRRYRQRPGQPWRRRPSRPRSRGHWSRVWRRWQQKKKRILSDQSRFQEYRTLRKVYTALTPRRGWRGPFVSPIRSPYSFVSSAFGKVRYLINGSGSPHRGIDYAADLGTPVYAAADGTVAFSRSTIVSGNVVILDHGLGVYSAYVHLHQSNVKKGDRVAAGTPIATVGSTGLSTGPHLHFGVKAGQVWVDPNEWLRGDPRAVERWYPLVQ